MAANERNNLLSVYIFNFRRFTTMGRKRNIAELKTALAGYQNKRLSKKEGDLNGQGKNNSGRNKL